MQKIWREVGLYESRKAGVQAFLREIAEQPAPDWESGVQAFRTHHYAVLGDIVPPLLASTDKLLRLSLIRAADVKQRKELNLLKKFIETAQPAHDELELLAILKLGHARLNDTIRQRTDLTSPLRRRLSEDNGGTLQTGPNFIESAAVTPGHSAALRSLPPSQSAPKGMPVQEINPRVDPRRRGAAVPGEPPK
jgi:hypothetical protein